MSLGSTCYFDFMRQRSTHVLKVIHLYNKNMGMVDRVDRNIFKYCINIGGKNGTFNSMHLLNNLTRSGAKTHLESFTNLGEIWSRPGAV